MNEKLNQLYNEDTVDRNKHISDEELDEKDRKRMVQVKEILSGEENLTAIDFHHAALIFQHGEKVEDYDKAHELAVKAVELGDESARWLVAASLDRSLLMRGLPQKYGTQFIVNEITKEWELALPIDPSVTDEQRAEWNVPSLKDALRVFKQKYGL